MGRTWPGSELTFTATACPCMEFIREDIRDRLLQEHWITRVEIRKRSGSPPWNRDMISEQGRSNSDVWGWGPDAPFHHNLTFPHPGRLRTTAGVDPFHARAGLRSLRPEEPG
jgi:metal-sulfur cluster biosynthetic enzyme